MLRATLSIAVVLAGAAVLCGQQAEQKLSETAQKAKEVVDQRLKKIDGTHGQVIWINDESLAKTFPKHTFFAVRYRIYPVAVKLQNMFYPLPNFGNASVLQSQNFRQSLTHPFDPNTYWTARIDHRFTQKFFVYGRYTWQRQHSTDYESNLPTVGRLTDTRDTRNAVVSFTSIFTPTLELMAAVGIAATVVLAARAVELGRLQPERVISFLATIVLLYQPLKNLGGTGQGVTQGLAGAQRLYEVLDEPEGLAEGGRELPRFAEQVRFERVSFRYPERSRRDPRPTGNGAPQAPLVLREVDLTLRRGEVVALVGPSGGGKTTLMNLVPRFADPSAGRVLIDGHDLREVSLRSLRAQVALVAQETFLFNDTVRGNIAYGRPDVSAGQLIAVAQAARADGFIRELPRGYDTEVGERGATLSGGQRQRIAIARALLKDAPILLLDEATSALDTESEREVQRALDRLMADRTCLVIAHRLSTIRHADRIAVLADGRVVELGTHDQLLATKGEYARLYALQFAAG